ncbi:hypothetical protein HOD05_00460 [Candidatus Woesearchaeota archaeon]|jgi:hypothetical protein|nr:hypothetical protein [Candidatus Woesearchaeota archaeon]MBT4150880.1 hypothetical protein [Candidatus Woesearchaeota archaeon]MBT4246893.1 hypothetical protein [Candidatus Woesearchaeota archaeon]MBT4433670.1 hypothetical protein [Candidatus Woesearchaeota archaeon]
MRFLKTIYRLFQPVDPIVSKNLKLMESVEEGGLQDLVTQESAGGNAGSFQGKLCAGANFHFDETGLIHEFTNDPSKKYFEGRFKIKTGIPSDMRTVDFDNYREQSNESNKIIRTEYDSPNVPKEAKIMIELSVKLYNELRE